MTLWALKASAEEPSVYDVEITDRLYRELPEALTDSLRTTSFSRGVGFVELPFPLLFHGVPHRQLTVATSGYLTLGSELSYCRDETPACARSHIALPIPSETFPNRVISAWWEDIFCLEGAIRTQTDGAPPRRTFSVQWGRGCSRLLEKTEGQLEFQIVLHEEDSSIEMRYGKLQGDLSFAASVGVMSPLENGIVAGTLGLKCSPLCGDKHWPQDRQIRFIPKPDLVVLSVEPADSIYAGARSRVTTSISNRGGGIVEPFGIRYWLAREPRLGPDAIDIGYGVGFGGRLASGVQTVLRDVVQLPEGLDDGPWYILAEADPDHVLREANRTNDIRASNVFSLTPPRPNFWVEAIEAPERLPIEGSFDVQLVARNDGKAKGSDVEWTLEIIPMEPPGSLGWELGTGRFDLEAGGRIEIPATVQLPASLGSGTYRFRFALDPKDELEEMDEHDNIHISRPVRVEAAGVVISTGTLPAAELGADYCVRLDAWGGDGAYHWRVSSGGLPPGLDVRSTPAGLLCGRPMAVGSFTFQLEVSSGNWTARRDFELEVFEELLELAITTYELPLGILGERYEAGLSAVGGEPPYRWELVSGELAGGIALGSDGVFSGSPWRRGTFPIEVSLTDARGESRQRQLLLETGWPDELRCDTRALPGGSIRIPFEGTLTAAGGRPPYTWRSLESRTLPTALGEREEVLGRGPPPGLSLAPTGQVRGEALRQGRFVWTVEVTDQDLERRACSVTVDIERDRGLTVITRTLSAAVVGQPYSIRLEAGGGTGPLRWAQVGADLLPEGMGLGSSGILEGTPTEQALRGREAFDHAFLVEVSDEHGRRGIAALSLEIISNPPPPPPPPKKEKDGGGCAAASGPDQLGWVALALAITGWRTGSRSKERRQGGSRLAAEPRRSPWLGLLLLGVLGASGPGCGADEGDEGSGQGRKISVGRTSVELVERSSVMADGDDWWSVVIHARDKEGKPAAGQAISALSSEPGDEIEIPDGKTDSQGIGLVMVRTTRAGTRVLRFTVGGVDLDGEGQRPSLRFDAGPAARLSFASQPSFGTAGRPLRPGVQVAVEDLHGNRVMSSDALIVISRGEEELERQPAVEGIARFDGLRIPAAVEGLQLKARSEGLEGATSEPFSIRIGSPAGLRIEALPAEIVAGEPLPVQVVLLDAGGNPVEDDGVQVQLSLYSNPSDARLQGELTTLTSGGIARFEGVTLQRRGEGYQLAARGDCCEGAISAPFAILPGAPSLATSSFHASTAAADGIHAAALAIVARDDHGNGIEGLSFQLWAEGSLNELSPSFGVTNAEGILRSRLRSIVAEPKALAAQAGELLLEAVAILEPGALDPASSQLTVSDAVAAAGGLEEIELRFLALDSNRNPIPGLLVMARSIGSGNRWGTGIAQWTDDDGRASFFLSSVVAEEKTATVQVGEASFSVPIRFE